MARTRKTKYWQHRGVPTIYMPANSRAVVDQSEFYIKTPQEMSRYEIAELERELRMLDEPDEPDEAGADDGPVNPEQLAKQSEEFAAYHQQLKQLIPIRNATIKRYFDKYKLQKKKREEIFAAVEASEDFIKGVLGDEYVHYTEAIPEIGEFIRELDNNKAASKL